ncbi:prepilin peptidase [Bacillus thuringiensis]|uniref:Prepilin leader peptidase/N-methyltransferase n=1 Tax=Bacillus thuringiensis TaxID=1428 RepID=A0A9X6WHS3_BACTU|nr:A24 family peptidase [Bacillus thuringiensis]PFJ29141.1 prepilin peptidase [Bacillus thuringiensis]
MSVGVTEQVFYTIIFFLFGLLFGSFFNVVGLRVPKGESIAFPGSHCTVCDRKLKWYELVPVLSYVFLLGKCRKCKTKISPLYPIMELITGILFAFTCYVFGLTLTTVFVLLIASMMVIITVSDITTQLIPNKILLVFSIVLIPLALYIKNVTWQGALIGFATAFGINLFILLISKGKGMGGGDIKLFLLLGTILGWKAFLTLFFVSVIIGVFVGLGFKITKGAKEFPFGPSIALGTIITIFYGNGIINWYLGLIL